MNEVHNWRKPYERSSYQNGSDDLPPNEMRGNTYYEEK